MGRLSDEAVKRIAAVMKNGTPTIAENWDEQREALVRHIEARGSHEPLFITVSDAWKEKAHKLIFEEHAKVEKAEKEAKAKEARKAAWLKLPRKQQDKVAHAADRACGIQTVPLSTGAWVAGNRVATGGFDFCNHRWSEAFNRELERVSATYFAPLTDDECAHVGAAADDEIKLFADGRPKPSGLRLHNISLVRRLEHGEIASGAKEWDAAAAKQLEAARDRRADGEPVIPAPVVRVAVNLSGHGVPSSAIGYYVEPFPSSPFGVFKNLTFGTHQWEEFTVACGGRDAAFKALEVLHGCKVHVSVVSAFATPTNK